MSAQTAAPAVTEAPPGDSPDTPTVKAPRVSAVRAAAATFLRLRPVFDQLAAERRELEAAEKILKEHFAATGKKTYGQHIVCKHGSQRRFDQDAAKQLLGREQVERCMVDRPTRSLILV